MLQMTRIGTRNILSGGMLVAAMATGTFGTIEFIPYKAEEYTIVAFAIRIVLSFGTSAIFTSCFALITDTFPQHGTFILVRDHFYCSWVVWWSTKD